jgi:hypothetical protein
MSVSEQMGQGWVKPASVSGKETESPQDGHLKSMKLSSVIMSGKEECGEAQP